LTALTNPFFNQTKAILVVPFLILFLIFFHRGYKIEKKIVYLFLIITTLISLQGLFWGFKPLTLFTYFSFTVLTPYFLYRVVGNRIFEYLAKIIYITAVYSIILWLMQVLIPPFDQFLQDFKIFVFHNYSFDFWPRSILLYTVANSYADLSVIDIYRNAGIYHEPGAFAYWLIIGIGLNTIITKNSFDRKNIMMSIALITTFSTAGYLQLFALSLFFVIRARINPIFKTIVFALFIFSSVHVYTSAEFLQEKISKHYLAQNLSSVEGVYTTGRFTRALKIMNNIKQSPVFGRGIITASEDNKKYSAYDMSGTLSLAIFARYGLLFGFLFYLFFYRGIKRVCVLYNFSQRFPIFFLLAIAIGGFSQSFFYDNITIQFFFAGLLVQKGTI
jgi:hypothetical protein